MPPRKRAANKHTKARQRRRLKAQERLDRDRVQAQQAAKALEQTSMISAYPITWWPRLKVACGANKSC